jgi:hypothetical protein
VIVLTAKTHRPANLLEGESLARPKSALASPAQLIVFRCWVPPIQGESAKLSRHSFDHIQRFWLERRIVGCGNSS